jgi:hypothetical protein
LWQHFPKKQENENKKSQKLTNVQNSIDLLIENPELANRKRNDNQQNQATWNDWFGRPGMGAPKDFQPRHQRTVNNYIENHQAYKPSFDYRYSANPQHGSHRSLYDPNVTRWN